MSDKARIVTVGTVEGGEPKGWEFDGEGSIPAMEITANGVLYGGYSVAELVILSRTEKKNAVMRALAGLYEIHSAPMPDLEDILDALEELMQAYDAWLD